MAVAPSFQTFKVISEKPFVKNNKLYITVENPSTTRQRDVRWYSDSEYAKLYGSKIIDAKKGFKNLKHARGFDNGPILVVRKNRLEDEDYLRRSEARYAVGIGWYFPSTVVFPLDTPPHLKFLALTWEEFRDGDDCHMKKPPQLTEILNQKARKEQWIDTTKLN